MECSLNECGVCASESVVAFCENCNFKICEACFQLHKKCTKLFNNHVAFAIEKTKTITNPSISDDDARDVSKNSSGDLHTHKCATHTTENLVFFCTEHAETLCGRCVFSRHKCCKVIDLFEVNVDDKDVSACRSHLKNMVEVLKTTENKIGKHATENNACKLEFLKDLQHLRTDVIAWFDRLQSKCDKECYETFETNAERFTQVRTFCQAHIKRIQERQELIDNLLTQHHVKQLYVLLNTVKQDIEEIELKLNRLAGESTFNGYSFKRSSGIEEVLNAHAFGIGGLEEWCSGSDEIMDDTLSPLTSSIFEVSACINTGVIDYIAEQNLLHEWEDTLTVPMSEMHYQYIWILRKNNLIGSPVSSIKFASGCLEAKGSKKDILNLKCEVDTFLALATQEIITFNTDKEAKCAFKNHLNNFLDINITRNDDTIQILGSHENVAKAWNSLVPKPMRIFLFWITVGQLSIEVQQGDIRNSVAEFIAVSSTAKMLKQVGASKLIRDMLGENYIQECSLSIKNDGEIKLGECRVINSGLCVRRWIGHVVVPTHTRNIEQSGEILTEAYSRCLTSADTKKCETLAMTCIGSDTSRGRFPLSECVHCLREAIEAFKPTHLRRIILVENREKVMEMSRLIQYSTKWQYCL